MVNNTRVVKQLNIKDEAVISNISTTQSSSSMSSGVRGVLENIKY